MKISEPLVLPCGHVLPHRLAKAALTENLATPNGEPSESHFRLYDVWDRSRCSFMLTGNVMVDGRDKEDKGNVVVENESLLPSLKKWVKACSQTQLWMQIGHAGALSDGTRTISPSGVPFQGKARSFQQSMAMELFDIEDVIERFTLTSLLAKQSGFTGIEIHSAHGFLLNQFLSPVTNRRTDSYGGSLQNRTRLLLEVIASVRHAVGANFPIAVKLNTSDGRNTNTRWAEQEALDVAELISEAGVDLIELSGGDYNNTLMIGRDRSNQYFEKFARDLKNRVKTPVMLTGGMRDIDEMNRIIAEGGADIIGLGRPLITDPMIVHKLLKGECGKIPACEADQLGVLELLSWYSHRMRNMKNESEIAIETQASF